MADCELIATCIFFNNVMADMPVMSDIMKERYCRRDNSKCARYMIFKEVGREKVPSNMFPVEKDRAEKIISQNTSL